MTTTTTTTTPTPEQCRPTRERQRGQLVVGDTVAGSVLLRKLIGEGGHARVYRGYCANTGFFRGVKVLERPEFLERFTSEFRLLVRLESPHIVRVHDFSMQPVPHYVMDFLPGANLRRYQRLAGGTLPVPEVLRILLQVCSGLEVMHDAGILHRDLSPRNVIRSPEGHITLIDLGIAKTLPESGGKGWTTDALGTKGFIAPEQRARFELDCRTDYYGLGALAYFLLTGTRYDPKTGVDIKNRHLRVFLEHLLAKDPQARFVSLEAIRDELSALEVEFTEPASTTVVTVHETRHRALGPLIALVSMLVVLAGAVGYSSLAEKTETSKHPSNVPQAAHTPTVDKPSQEAPPSLVPVSEEPAPEIHHLPAPAEQALSETTPSVTTPEARPVSNGSIARSQKSKAAKRRFHRALRAALRSCPLSPQKLTYRVHEGKIRLSGPDLGSMQKGCLRLMLPTTGNFRGTFNHRANR